MAHERVIIVGGSSGMGLASAKRLAAEGYEAVVSARSEERIAQTVAAIGSGTTGFTLDYLQPVSITAFFQAASSFDHLVLAGAGPAAWGGFQELKPEGSRALLPASSGAISTACRPRSHICAKMVRSR